MQREALLHADGDMLFIEGFPPGTRLEGDRLILGTQQAGRWEGSICFAPQGGDSMCAPVIVNVEPEAFGLLDALAVAIPIAAGIAFAWWMRSRDDDWA